MIREGARRRVSVFLFKTVVQSVFLFGVETWVVTPCIEQVLGFLKYQVVRKLKERIPRLRWDGIWEYTSTEAVR